MTKHCVLPRLIVTGCFVCLLSLVVPVSTNADGVPQLAGNRDDHGTYSSKFGAELVYMSPEPGVPTELAVVTIDAMVRFPQPVTGDKEFVVYRDGAAVAASRQTKPRGSAEYRYRWTDTDAEPGEHRYVLVVSGVLVTAPAPVTVAAVGDVEETLTYIRSGAVQSWGVSSRQESTLFRLPRDLSDTLRPYIEWSQTGNHALIRGRLLVDRNGNVLPLTGDEEWYPGRHFACGREDDDIVFTKDGKAHLMAVDGRELYSTEDEDITAASVFDDVLIALHRMPTNDVPEFDSRLTARRISGGPIKEYAAPEFSFAKGGSGEPPQFSPISSVFSIEQGFVHGWWRLWYSIGIGLDITPRETGGFGDGPVALDGEGAAYYLRTQNYAIDMMLEDPRDFAPTLDKRNGDKVSTALEIGDLPYPSHVGNVEVSPTGTYVAIDVWRALRNQNDLVPEVWVWRPDDDELLKVAEGAHGVAWQPQASLPGSGGQDWLPGDDHGTYRSKWDAELLGMSPPPGTTSELEEVVVTARVRFSMATGSEKEFVVYRDGTAVTSSVESMPGGRSEYEYQWVDEDTHAGDHTYMLEVTDVLATREAEVRFAARIASATLITVSPKGTAGTFAWDAAGPPRNTGTRQIGEAKCLTLSPDGRRLCWVGGEVDGKTQLKLCTIDSSDPPRPLTSFGHWTMPAWSADGRSILCAQSDPTQYGSLGIWSVDPETGASRRVVDQSEGAIVSELYPAAAMSLVALNASRNYGTAGVVDTTNPGVRVSGLATGSQCCSAWLPDGSGLLVVTDGVKFAGEPRRAPCGLWRYDTDELRAAMASGASADLNRPPMMFGDTESIYVRASSPQKCFVWLRGEEGGNRLHACSLVDRSSRPHSPALDAAPARNYGCEPIWCTRDGNLALFLTHEQTLMYWRSGMAEWKPLQRNVTSFSAVADG